MNIIFLTNLYPKENEKEVRSKMRVDMNDAANALQWNLVNGIEVQGSVELMLVNRLPVFSWPRNYPEAFVKSFYFSHKEGANDITPGFCNITGIKQFVGDKAFVKQVINMCDNRDESIILMYSLQPAFLKAVKEIKRLNPQTKVCAIVADLPQFSAVTHGIISRLFHQFNCSQIYKNLKYIDGFVLLTKQMAKKMEIKVPYIVMEGIAPSRTSNGVIKKKNTEKRKILYTGSMNSQYGICVLLEAFSMIENPNIELHLCGLGNAEERVKEYANKDHRIIFYGKISRSEVLKLQSEVDVLVNPRQNNEEFTKYSFPSKNLEYLSSGVPLVAYKLDGIPDEYDEYINYVEDSSSKALAVKLQQICELDDETRAQIGQKAQKFVLENKNHIVQAQKILRFICENI